jgi:uncharacterized protein (DUF1501 family)
MTHLSRRSLLGAALAAVPLRYAHAASLGRKRLIVITLRGGLDGLHWLPAYGDPAYAKARGALALSPGAGALKLDSLFGLHAAMPQLAARYAAGQALFLHAVASPYRERSHFDAQNLLESGGTAPYRLQSGWLNRTLAALPDARAVAVGAAMPLLLQGPAPASSWSPSTLPDVAEDTLTRLARLYAGDAQLDMPLRAALKLDAVAGSDSGNAMGGRRGLALAATAGIAVRLMREPQGPNIVAIEGGGWDSHAGQAAMLSARLGDLDQALATLNGGLKTAWRDTVAVVITEFGRTVAVNGTGGTDHGTGMAALLLGGGVKGGRVLADWPGLAPSALLDGRDVRPTNDLRALLKGVLSEHLGLDPGQLARSIFPDSGSVAPLSGLMA